RDQAHGPDRDRSFQSILAVTVEDQDSLTGLIRERLAQLLDDPRAGRLTRDVDVQDPPTIMTDHEETIKQAKGHRRNREKVHRSNGFAMIAEKREPPFRGFRVSRRMTHPAGDVSLGNIESKHQELTMDSWGAPGWVLVHHPENQIT